MSKITLAALIIFAVTYILMMAFQKIRPYVTIASALIFIGLGIVSAVAPNAFGEGFFAVGDSTYAYGFVEALREIDWNVIMMIAGTMGTVYLFIESKMPQLMSDILISKMPNVKWVVVALSLFAGIVSAFVDNVATVLMIAPVAMAFCKKLDISPVPSKTASRYPQTSRAPQRSWATRPRYSLQRLRISTSPTSLLTTAEPVCSG